MTTDVLCAVRFLQAVILSNMLIDGVIIVGRRWILRCQEIGLIEIC